MRLILAAITALLVAAPAAAQRLDTRVYDVVSGEKIATHCRLNANSGMLIKYTEQGPRATLFQPPVEADPALEVTLAMTFRPQPDTRFSSGASVVGLELLPRRRDFSRRFITAHLLIDGVDTRVKLLIQTNPDRPGATYLTVPDAARPDIANQILHARWVDFEVNDDKAAVHRYRFDGLRITDAAEILSIIKFSCDGFRAN